MADNTITVSGNVTRDPELKFTQSGQAVANMSVAVNRRYQRQNEWVEETSFFDCVIWGDMAENATETFARGARVIVTGRLEQQTWETQEGDKRSKVQIVVEDIGPSVKWATAVVTKTERKDNPSGTRSASTGRTSRPPAGRVQTGKLEEEEPW